jgi:hypothetical protein
VHSIPSEAYGGGFRYAGEPGCSTALDNTKDLPRRYPPGRRRAESLNMQGTIAGRATSNSIWGRTGNLRRESRT